MSRVGKKPIPLPAGVKFTLGSDFKVEGPKGKLTVPIPPGIRIEQKGNTYALPTGESFVGRPKAIDALRADPAAVQTIRERVLAATIEFDPAEVEPGDEDE